MFSETSLKYTATPTFAMNSMYNFGEWEMLPPPSNLSFPPATVTAAADWLECWPSTGGLTAVDAARSTLGNAAHAFLIGRRSRR